jgi:hypothetical protein
LECVPTVAFPGAINGVVAPTVYENMYGFAESVSMNEERTGFAGPVTVAREPYGVVVTILGYNGTLSYLGMKALPTLPSGNVVVLKLRVETRLVAQYVAQSAKGPTCRPVSSTSCRPALEPASQSDPSRAVTELNVRSQVFGSCQARRITRKPPFRRGGKW